MNAAIFRLMTFADSGQPKMYGGSDRMRTDFEEVISMMSKQGTQIADLQRQLEEKTRLLAEAERKGMEKANRITAQALVKLFERHGWQYLAVDTKERQAYEAIRSAAQNLEVK